MRFYKAKTPLYATSSHTNKVIYDHDLTGPIAWVLGHEGQGVRDEFLNNAIPIALPQPGGQESPKCWYRRFGMFL